MWFEFQWISSQSTWNLIFNMWGDAMHNSDPIVSIISIERMLKSPTHSISKW